MGREVGTVWGLEDIVVWFVSYHRLFLFKVVDVIESVGRIDGNAEEDKRAVPVEKAADVGVVVQTLALVAVEGTARKHEKGASKTFNEHTFGGGDAIASIFGIGTVLRGASLVGQS